MPAAVADGLRNVARVSAPESGRPAHDVRWAALMVSVQAGDAAAYETLLREVTPRIRALCLARLREPADAEDAVQDALMTLHALRHTYDPTRPFGPWLATIALRRAVDRQRRRARIAAREASLEGMPEAAGAQPDMELLIDAARLPAALAELPESQRLALGLAKLQELPLAEAAARSGRTASALKVATHRAMRSLRRRLGVGREGHADR